MRAIMDFRNPFIIEEELKDVRELIHLNEELLSEFPDDDDPALEFNLNYLKGLETELINELNESNEFHNIDLFDVVIKDDNDKVILLDDFADISRSFQKMIIPLAQTGKGKPVQLNESPPVEIMEGTSLGLVEVAAGSLRMILRTDPQTRFSSFVKIAFDRFDDLLECGDNVELLKHQTEKLGPEPMKRYKNFMGIVSKKEVNVTLFDEFKPLKAKKTEITNEFAESVYKVIGIKQKPIEKKIIIEGVLGVINTFYYNFTIKDSKNNKINVHFDKVYTNKISRMLDKEVKVEALITETYHELEDKFDKKREFIRFL